MKKVFRTIKIPLSGFLLLAALWGNGSFASAQTKPAAAASASLARSMSSILHLKKLAAEKELEERIRKVISGQIDTPYLLYVKFTLDEKGIQAQVAKVGKPVRLKTLPSGTDNPGLEFVRGLDVEELYAYVSNVVVSLTLDKSMSAEQEKAIEQSILGALGLRQERGDKVEITRADMTSGSMKSKLEMAAKETASAREQTRKLETMLKEMEQKQKSDTSGSRIADDLKRIADDLKATREGLVELKAAQENQKKETVVQFEGPLAPVKRLLAGLELPLTLLPLGLLLGFVLLRVAAGQGKTGAALRDGLSELGKSVQAMADTLAAAAGKSSGSSGHEKSESESVQQRAVVQGESPSGGGEAMGLLQEEVARTWELLSERPYFGLSVLKDWLAESEGQMRFLQVVEAIGAQNASGLWRRLPAQEVDALGALLEKPIPKSNAFGAVSLLYRAAVREAGARPAIAAELPELEILIELTDAQLAALLSPWSDAPLAAVLVFLSPKRTARVLGKMGDRVSAELLAALGEASRQTPETLRKSVVEFQEAVKKSGVVGAAGGDLVPYLATFLESQSLPVRQAAQEFLSERGELASEVRKRVITFADVLTLDEDSLYDLVGNLSPLDAAQLASTLAEAEKEKVLAFFKGKVRFQVDEELKKIDSKPRNRKQAAMQAERIKAGICRKARILREQGLVEFGAVQESESLVPEAKAS